MVDNFFFLCNRVMLLLLLLNIVDIVVLKTTGFIFLVLTTIQTMVDNSGRGRGWGFVGLCGAFGHLPQLIIQRLPVNPQHSCSLRLIAATLL